MCSSSDQARPRSPCFGVLLGGGGAWAGDAVTDMGADGVATGVDGVGINEDGGGASEDDVISARGNGGGGGGISVFREETGRR